MSGMQHNRHSIRLKGYDYSQSGYYFITICTKDSIEYFGEICNGKMLLNQYGEMAKSLWLYLPEYFQQCHLDIFIIMPDHFHGIVVINKPKCRGRVTLPLQNKHTTLGQIIGYYKYQTTKSINEIKNTIGKPLWHRNYYERIIRNEIELYNTRQYILNNPVKWQSKNRL